MANNNGDFGLYELMDRCSVLESTFDRFVRETPAFERLPPEAQKAVDNASSALANAYQELGKAYYASEEEATRDV